MRFGELLLFGGPKGNVPVGSGVSNGWGLNWDAFNDSLRELENGGIWGTSVKIRFPVKLVIHNHASFSKSDPEGFAALKEILNHQKVEYERNGKQLDISFD